MPVVAEKPGSTTTSWTMNDDIVAAFRERLKNVAGFRHVPEPVAMRNKMGAVVYYLFFASPKPVARDIVTFIFDKYRARGSGSHGTVVH